MNKPLFPGTINPLTDSRWGELVEWHPHASIFHHPSWLQALHRTYGFTPLAFTSSSAAEPLRDGLVFCPIRSWITGKRLVSLPFSDHCDTLADSEESRGFLSTQIAKALTSVFDYAEIRSTYPLQVIPDDNWRPSNRFLLHTISLRPSNDDIFRGFHRDCIRRKIKRAQREQLQYVAGRSDPLLDIFYALLIRTRRRHRIPPQPFRWFRNLRDCMGDRLNIHVALKDGHPTTAMLTLRHQKTLTYKYGCSDERLNHLGGMPFLFWQVIQEAKCAQIEQLDLGRSEMDNEGLTTFKQHLGATAAPLTYWTYSDRASGRAQRGNILQLAQHVMPLLPASMLCLPRAILSLPGALLYRHMD